ncbi:spermidine/putrescine ABC transporter substrate-binding protein [Patescibacteria group bacterium]|nr:spermidine/putrescine ABC transporter substrate-binding protein [Patescibacteria group bacterium]MBU1673274.1 spermidine/putrescine ABC transporter substrate-binding protein [Patescibacteria group bacterium]MBU1964082.1 spermidine/putrescine ABC transporter substrate-binding protein [Patescibacteria group bacterium]
MKKTGLILLIIGAVIILVLAIAAVFWFAIKQEDGVADQAKKELAEELNVYNWDDYIDPEVVADFEKEFGVKVNLDTYEDEDEMFNEIKLVPGKYDVVFPSEELLQEMIIGKTAEPLDLKNIPNLKNLYPQYQNPAYDPGSQHAVAYDWGYTGIIYDKNQAAAADISWNMFSDPKYAGRAALLNSPTEVIGSVLLNLGYDFTPGSKEPFDRAYEILQGQKENIIGFIDPIEIRKKMVKGELWLAQEYSGEAAIAMEKNPDLEFAVPPEGAGEFTDVVAVPWGTPHKYTAEVFLNFLLRPDIQARNCAYTGYSNPNQAAVEQGLVDEEVLNNKVIYPPQDVIDRLKEWPLLGADEKYYTEIWEKIN